MNTSRSPLMRCAVGLIPAVVCGMGWGGAYAAPLVLDPNLTVELAASGLSQPTTMAFVGANDFFVLEKATGQVKRMTNGVATVVLDLPVNSASERGLLGIAVSPDFANDNVVHLFWTESSTGSDTSVIGDTPLLGNRVDRFIFNGNTLSLDQNLLRLRATQADAGEAARANHNGGILRYGPDGKLYVMAGDVGRRGWLQNLAAGPAGTGSDDQFGGPQPDDAHLSGVILRLNPDGSVPADNPFFGAGASLGGEVGSNVQMIYSYGHRNSFGLDFDPATGDLWMVDNGDDAFDEINRVTAGMNGGWVQIMGPVSRVEEFKAIEVNEFGGTLGEVRWPPTNIADTPAEAMSRLLMLPGAVYVDPAFSWKYAMAPSALGFLDGTGLGAEYAGNMFVGAGSIGFDEGYLFRFLLDGGNLLLSDVALADLVADNSTRGDGTQSESLRFGTGFGVITDIRTGPDGSLYVVSLTDGAVYRIGAAGVSGVAVPEPATTLLLPVAMLGMMGLMRRRHPKA